ncbi:MAG: GGDEF domain-containing protein [Chloroflexi bacterium]|nr:GGDEF domain-containing protein [Chloroflexota bacterium]
MQKLLIKLGHFGSILLFTAVGIFLTLAVISGITIITNQNGDEGATRLALQVAAVITFIGAITLGSYLTKLIFKTHELEKEIAKLKEYDTLTGLLNRRTFMDRAEHLFHIAVREEEALSIIVIDIDHFKNINDVHGHIAGNQALVAFTKLLRSTLRKSDLACRYGGEEFALFLPKTNEQQGWTFCERIHQITKEQGVHYGDIEINPTLSIGVVSFPVERADSAEGLLRLADRALYHAKKTGRNRTVNYIDGI